MNISFDNHFVEQAIIAVGHIIRKCKGANETTYALYSSPQGKEAFIVFKLPNSYEINNQLKCGVCVSTSGYHRIALLYERDGYGLVKTDQAIFEMPLIQDLRVLEGVS